MLVDKQLEVLNSYPDSFYHRISKSKETGITFKGLRLSTFQMNIGKWCNQACKHCHVDASPKRTELMSRDTIDLCLKVISENPNITTVDITGGAPEGNPHFTYLVKEAKKLGKKVIDRCNLTILEEEGFAYLYDFFAENDVEIFSSLPFFSETQTDKQRGDGVFKKSITAIKKLNDLGYGKERILNLVYNPVGLYLSSSQKQLEKEFKENLFKKFGIYFNQLFCINNLPISRFLSALVRAEKFEMYMDTLVNAYNPQTIEGLMCRHQISVGYDGKVYDCDFNQMLELTSLPFSHISEFSLPEFLNRQIVVANHCYGCTAGAGSSCGGEIV